MMEKSCRCGKIKKKFMIDIGAFFIADCCIEAGYDHLGKMKDIGLSKEEVSKLVEDPVIENMEIVDEGEVSEETPQEKKARKKAEKEAAKALKKAKQS